MIQTNPPQLLANITYIKNFSSLFPPDWLIHFYDCALQIRHMGDVEEERIQEHGAFITPDIRRCKEGSAISGAEQSVSLWTGRDGRKRAWTGNSYLTNELEEEDPLIFTPDHTVPNISHHSHVN